MPDQTSPAGPAVPAAEGELTAEDAKLVTLARGARARVGAVEGAAVRDLASDAPVHVASPTGALLGTVTA